MGMKEFSSCWESRFISKKHYTHVGSLQLTCLPEHERTGTGDERSVAIQPTECTGAGMHLYFAREGGMFSIAALQQTTTCPPPCVLVYTNKLSMLV